MNNVLSFNIFFRILSFRHPSFKNDIVEYAIPFEYVEPWPAHGELKPIFSQMNAVSWWSFLFLCLLGLHHTQILGNKVA